MAELPKSYTPSSAQEQVAARWDAAKAFHADPADPGKPFCIVIPPPNVTAALHLGHALNNTLQDVLIRYHRMAGDNTLWMPGTDHAGIATQTVVEKRLLLQGKRRTDFTREQFIEKVQTWKDEYEATIISQLKSFGCSCDYDRTRFTMDEVCAKAVREAFFQLFKDGLIYRGKRLVNWDPVTQTALADDEVEMVEVQGHMWYLRYPLVEESGTKQNDDAPRYVVVATTRPETMLGDTAVAVNPKDPFAAQFIGRKVKLPIVDREIPIIADDYVVVPVERGGDENDPKARIATGFLKVTPAHDPNDYEIGQRHNLPMINVMAPDATISDQHGWTDVTSEAQQFIGLSREEARKQIVNWFKAHNLLEDIKPYTHSVGHSYRSHVPIEPYLSDQWYVKVTDDRLKGEALRAMAPDQREGVASLSEPARSRAGTGTSTGTPGATDAPAQHENQHDARHEDVPARTTPRQGDGELRFFPSRYAKTYQQWHENIRDWCISRQIWWGHRIPVWHKRVMLTQQNWSDELLSWGWDSFVEGKWRDKGIEVRIVRLSDGSVVDPKSDRLMPIVKETEGEYDIFICMRDEECFLKSQIEDLKFQQDPDVLDTWFSSALWPISTMGWPDPSAFPEEIPEGDALLEKFNPSSVLCTGRDIITLWVSRMVMFNRYFRDGKLPFYHVYINPMIQDGHGQRMSKSLGNGVDPRDIVHSHGADALRFTLVQIATSTQDVRLPVDMACPHCSHMFQPKEITSPAGYRVAAPEQNCPNCKKPMISGYGAASGLASPTDEAPLARNSSSKFDLGRNFANKIWNATRFALSNLNADTAGTAQLDELPLVDRWIIARLHRTLHAVEDALNAYQFNVYAEAMYDLVWRDFCDWYLEAIKPTVKTNPAQQQVLRTVLNAIMRLLHPIMPFVTETLWPHIQAAGPAGLDGIVLPPNDLLATAAWPDIACRVEDASAVATFERVQNLTNAIRALRAERQVPPRKRIRLAAPQDVLDLIAQAGGVVETLAGLEQVELHSKQATTGPSIPLAFEGRELHLSGLVDEVDIAAERNRLAKVIADKERAIMGFRNRLSNEGYLSKAPPEKVEETRRMLSQAEADLAAAQRALESLD